jgi:hypothetical protein
MIEYLSWIFLPIQPFIMHPERIAIAATLFLLGYAGLRFSGRFQAQPLLIAGIAWGLWVPWEWHCAAMRYDIRVDLLILYPLIVCVTIWSLVAAFALKSCK